MCARVWYWQKRKSATVSVEVKKSQHRYVIGPKGAGLTEILASTGVSVEIPPSDNVSETITLRGDPDKLGPALTMVYAKVCACARVFYDYFQNLIVNSGFDFSGRLLAKLSQNRCEKIVIILPVVVKIA